ncbi:MAG: ferrous iron transporter B [Puniceicoccales bacterium]|jgi:ferrous iron transport protein B|nr:ferrous iron transporter B [Puniceicoccales bacterium]
MRSKIALLGQPNSGKSTFFNSLTHIHRKTGNWTGKAVDAAEAEVQCGADLFTFVDLPGAYDLSFRGDGGKILCNCLGDEQLHGAVIFIDGSQLGKSFYFLFDFIGINIPTIIAITMADRASARGLKIDFRKLKDIFGVPVVPIVTTRRGMGKKMIPHLRCLLKERPMLCRDIIFPSYEKILGNDLGTCGNLSVESIPCDPLWMKIKCLERNSLAQSPLPSDSETVGSMAEMSYSREACTAAAVRIASCRYEKINGILKAATHSRNPPLRHLSLFDSLATHPIYGLFIAFAILLIGFSGSICAAEWGQCAMRHLFQVLEKSPLGHISPFLSLFLREAIFPGLSIGSYLVVFVGGLTLTLEIMENVGYMARIAYLFDGIMDRVGLQGKCVLPFLSGFGCTVAAVSSSRIIDSPRQRLLTIATSWVIPCSGTWGMVTLISALFFGRHAIWIFAFLFLLATIHIAITARIFGGKNCRRSQLEGMLMELPPYHHPDWRQIGCDLKFRIAELLKSSIPIILFTVSVLWLFTHSAAAMLIHIDEHVRGFEKIIGIRWELFVVLLLSIGNRESALGGLAIFFCGDSNFVSGCVPHLESTLRAALTMPQALAFLVAFFLNVPCCAAIAATANEVQSVRWTVRLCVHYVILSLVAAAITFHITSLFL